MTRSGAGAAEVADGHPDRSTAVDALEPGQTHEMGDPLARAAHTPVGELGVDPRHAASPPAALVDPADLAGQSGVGTGGFIGYEIAGDSSSAIAMSCGGTLTHKSSYSGISGNATDIDPIALP